MTSSERLSILSKLGIEISQALNAKYTKHRPWTLNVPSLEGYSVCLRNAGNGRIWLQMTSSKGYDLNDRLHISGDLNIGKNRSYVEVRDANYQRITPGEITVAVARGPEVIAREIATRFLPHYLDVLEKANDKVKAEADYEAKLTANLQRLAKVAGVSVGTVNYRNEVNREFTLKSSGHYHTVKTNETDVDMSLDSLTFDQAEYIIRYLKGEL